MSSTQSASRWRAPKNFLIIISIIVPIAFSSWMALLNNFVIEKANFDGSDIGLLQSVREIPGLAATVSHLVEFKAWSTAPGTCEMSGWLERRSLEELSSDGCWWLVMRALKVKVHVELDSVLRLAAEYGCLRIVKRL